MTTQPTFISERLYQRTADPAAFDNWYRNRGLSQGDTIKVVLTEGTQYIGRVERSGHDGIELSDVVCGSDNTTVSPKFITTQDEPWESTYFKGPSEDYIWGKDVEQIMKCYPRKN